MKPLIGITSGEIINSEQPWAPFVYGQKRNYVEAVLAAGGIPMVIPFMPEAELRVLYERLDGVLFAGGNDLNPSLYGEEESPLTIGVSDARDKVETFLMQWTLADNKPLLAICRGTQLLNDHCGGRVNQDLKTQFPGATDHELSTHKQSYEHVAHQLKVAPESRLASIIGDVSLEANTHHHQGVKKLGHGLRATAWSEDGVIEGIENPSKSFVLGLQCHPEGLHENDEKWAAVFRAFALEASKQVVPARLFKFKSPLKKSKKLTLLFRRINDQ